MEVRRYGPVTLPPRPTTEEERVTLDAEGAVVKTRTQLDPRETLRRVLDDTGLDAVRAVLDAVDPSALPAASWLPPL